MIEADMRYPQLIAFDLDYTLWDFWIDTHVEPPITQSHEHPYALEDSAGTLIEFYPDVYSILHQLRPGGRQIRARVPVDDIELDSGESDAAMAPVANDVNESEAHHDATTSNSTTVEREKEREKERQAVVLAICSRSSAPELAREALSLIKVPKPLQPSVVANGVDGKVESGLGEGNVFLLTPNAIDFFDELEIYPGSKIKHFKRIHERTGIPYSEMLFYDDEFRNREVERLGVTFIHVPKGLDKKIFQRGLKTWRARQG